nr:MAG TPA: hypothetical protein [Caudoviricetes sp.]
MRSVAAKTSMAWGFNSNGNKGNRFSIEYFKIERFENICLAIYSLTRLIRRSI